ICFDTITAYTSGARVAHFVIYNETDSTFWFSTYEDRYSHNGHAITAPLYCLDVRYNGRWKDTGLMWCGNGIHMWTLDTGGHLYFETQIHENRPEEIK